MIQFTPRSRVRIEALAASKIEVLDAMSEVVTVRPGRVTARPSVGDSVTRGALALFSTQPFTWGASLLTTALAPGLMGADALGQLTIAVSFVTLLASATSLGVSEYLVRRIAQHPASLQQDLGVALALQTITAVLSAIVIWALSPFLTASFVDSRLLYVALAGSLFIPAQTVLLSSFRGRELHTPYAWFSATGTVLGQVAGLLVLLTGAGALGYLVVQSLAIAGTTLFSWKLSGLRLSLPSVSDGSLLRAFREFTWGGFPFLTLGLTFAVTSGIDRVLLGLFVPAAEVGWYAAAYRVFAIPVFIPTLIITPLFPALSRIVNETGTIRRTVAETTRIVLLLMVPLTAGTIVIAPAIPALLHWPADFDNAVPMMSLLSLQLPLAAVDMVFGVVLIAIGLQRRWVVVGLLAAGLKIALNLAVIPVFENVFGNGAVGASIVTIVSEVLMFVGAVMLIPKHLLDPRVTWDATRIVVAGVATVIVGTALLPYGLILSIFGGAGTYVLLTVALRVLTVGDLRRLLARVPTRLRPGACTAD